MNQERIDAFMRNFPAPELIMQMEPEELGPHVLRHLLRQHAETNRFNFALGIPGGEITDRFMEAWDGSSGKDSSRIGPTTCTD
jgi:hypothetical protein